MTVGPSGLPTSGLLFSIARRGSAKRREARALDF
jgi:hypothetical protein